MFADPWTTPSVPLSSPLQFAGGSQLAPPGFRQRVAQGTEQAKAGLKQGADAAQAFLGRYGKYAVPAVAAVGAIPAVRESLSEINEGRPLGAVAALAPAGLSALGAGMIGRTGQAMLGKGGVAGTAIGLGLMGLGALLPGAAASGAESARQKATGEPTKGKEGEFSTQMAINKQLAELGTTQYRDNMGVYTSSIRDLSKAQSDQDYLNLQRNIPLINKLKNADLVRQQALMNTQNQGYMQQGVLATAGSLALGGQQNVAQLTNTALQTNPYAGAIMQAPQIRFG
jgi:hypothetical protein